MGFMVLCVFGFRASSQAITLTTTSSGYDEKRLVSRSGGLGQFILRPDSSYQWSVLNRDKRDGLQVLSVSLTSQTWSPAYLPSDSPLWMHRLTVYIPDKPPVAKTAVLHINGGTNHPRTKGEKTETCDDLDFERLVRMTGQVVVDVKDIPNQFLSLKGERPRKEDDLIARTWAAYIDAPEKCADCPLQLPMTKAVVRAMDAVQELLQEQFQKEEAGKSSDTRKSTNRQSFRPETFILTGGSKRGWVAWLAAATDTRVSAVMPMVIDVLDVQASLEHLKRVYGHWTPPLTPYFSRGQDILARLHTPPVVQLMKLVDPVQYSQYLNLPKYIVTAGGDDFFPPDSSRYYWSALTAPRWIRTYPNSRHYIVREDAERVTDTVGSFVGGLLADNLEQKPLGASLPYLFKTNIDSHGGRVVVSQEPKGVVLWQAINPDARDFRKTILQPKGLAYESTSLPFNCESKSSRCYVDVKVPSPKKGWAAWFVSFRFDNGSYPDFVFNTPVQVTPDTDLFTPVADDPDIELEITVEAEGFLTPDGPPKE